ncbi:hypothetical protein SDJN02_06124 [Cucurbita argyrosperma subsp. argyrosperma]|nr:hypothetical protein SDJN02_06124 [Cucurbita argyrosperma subsp. argyrosperma]
MTRAQLKEQADASLEIISFGSLHRDTLGEEVLEHSRRRGCLFTNIWHGKRLCARLMEGSGSLNQSELIARKKRRNHGIETEKLFNSANLKRVGNCGSGIRSMTEKLSSSASVNEVNQGFCGMYVKKVIKDSSFTEAKRKNNSSATSLASVPATSTGKDKKFINCQLTLHLHDGNTKDVLKKEDRAKQEYMHILHGKYESAVPSFVLPKHGPDNLEGEQHYDHAYINGNFSCCRQWSSKKSRDSEVGWNVHGTSQEGHFYVSECPLGCTSSGRVLSDETMRNNKRMDKCPLNLQINSLKVDNNGESNLVRVDPFLNSRMNANDSSVRRTSAYPEALSKEVIVRKEAAGMDTVPSSQVPSIVYSRIKAQNVSHLAKEYNRPSDEAYDTSCLGNHYGAETSSTESPHSSYINQINPSLDLDEASLRAYKKHNSGLLDTPRKENFTSNCNARDYVKELLCAMSTSSKNIEEHSLLQLKDSAIWLFASTISDSRDSHDYLLMDCQINHAELWKLMLLADSTVTFETATGASAGRGIIRTWDGLVYMWALSAGNKLGTLLCFTGIATDNKEIGVVAITADSRQLVYLLSSDGKR